MQSELCVIMVLPSVLYIFKWKWQVLGLEIAAHMQTTLPTSVSYLSYRTVLPIKMCRKGGKNLGHRSFRDGSFKSTNRQGLLNYRSPRKLDAQERPKRILWSCFQPTVFSYGSRPKKYSQGLLRWFLQLQLQPGNLLVETKLDFQGIPR